MEMLVYIYGALITLAFECFFVLTPAIATTKIELERIMEPTLEDLEDYDKSLAQEKFLNIALFF